MTSGSPHIQAEYVPVLSARSLFGTPGSTTPKAVIDLRSPMEFAEDHVPGAVNVPLFDDDDRRVIGTMYRWDSPDEAFREASSRTRERIAGFVAETARLLERPVPGADLREEITRRTQKGIADMEARLTLSAADVEAPVVMHCWRGGLRSRSVVAFLRDLGWEDVVGLEGGYKGYRSAVRDHIAEWNAPRAFCLRGLTGVGKTLVLRALERIRPGWTIDLEGLAAHRSSILGSVGLAPVTQRRFESRLAERLQEGFPGPVVYEGESRKVGDIILPAGVWSSLQGACDLELTASLERRVEVLIEDYLAHPENLNELEAKLPFIEKRLGPRKWDGVLVALLREGREQELVAILLEEYYDPLYRHSEKHHCEKKYGESASEQDSPYAKSFDTRDPEVCASKIAEFIESYSG